MTDINEKDFEKIETEDLNYYLLENMKEMTGEESEIRDTLFLFLNIPFALHSYIPQHSIWT